MIAADTCFLLFPCVSCSLRPVIHWPKGKTKHIDRSVNDRSMISLQWNRIVNDANNMLLHVVDVPYQWNISNDNSRSMDQWNWIIGPQHHFDHDVAIVSCGNDESNDVMIVWLMGRIVRPIGFIWNETMVRPQWRTIFLYPGFLSLLSFGH